MSRVIHVAEECRSQAFEFKCHRTARSEVKVVDQTISEESQLTHTTSGQSWKIPAYI